MKVESEDKRKANPVKACSSCKVVQTVLEMEGLLGKHNTAPEHRHIPQCHTAMKGLKVTLSSLADIHPIFKTANRAQVGL